MGLTTNDAAKLIKEKFLPFEATSLGKRIAGDVNGNKNVYKAQSGDTRTADKNEVEKALKADKTEEEKLASTQPGANSFKPEEKESPNSNNNSSETSNHEWSNCPHCQQAASQVKTKDEEIS
jgi:hypothetical protein